MRLLFRRRRLEESKLRSALDEKSCANARWDVLVVERKRRQWLKAEALLLWSHTHFRRFANVIHAVETEIAKFAVPGRKHTESFRILKDVVNKYDIESRNEKDSAYVLYECGLDYLHREREEEKHLFWFVLRTLPAAKQPDPFKQRHSPWPSHNNKIFEKSHEV